MDKKAKPCLSCGGALTETELKNNSCDICGCHIDGTGYSCRPCDFDMCSECFNKDPSFKLQELSKALASRSLSKTTVFCGPIAFLYLAKGNDDSAILEAVTDKVSSELSSTGLLIINFSAASDAFEKATAIMSTLGIEDLSKDRRGFMLAVKYSKKYLLDPDDGLTPQSVGDFLHKLEYKPESLKPFVKSQDAPPGHLEPMLPGCHRITTKTWDDVVVNNTDDIFIQEFADWCPYCLLMHPYTNDLCWVMEPVKNVRICKIDCSKNETGGIIDKYLKSEGIPNILFLKAKNKDHPPRSKIEFGAQNEGNEPAMKVEDMVAFIHRNMDGAKFDEDKYRLRAKLVQGQCGFLSTTAKDIRDSGGKPQTWIDALLGPIQGEGRHKKRLGIPSYDKEKNQLRENPWNRAIRAAVFAPDMTMEKQAGTTPVELVLAKLQQQIFQDIKNGDDGLNLEQGKRLLEEAHATRKEMEKQLGVTESGLAKSTEVDNDHPRQVSASVLGLRILDIDTVKWRFDAAFTLRLRWMMTRHDIVKKFNMKKELGADDDLPWQPPELILRNALLYPDRPEVQPREIQYFKYGDKWFAEQSTDISGAFIEVLELGGFPFDVQPLSLVMNFQSTDESWELCPEWELFEKSSSNVRKMVSYSPYCDLAEWTLKPALAEIYVQNYGPRDTKLDPGTFEQSSHSNQKPEDDKRPAIIVKAIAKRNWAQFLWTMWYVVAVLGVVGNGAFLIDNLDGLGDRLAVFLTNFLALTAFQANIDDQLPKIAYVSYFQLYLILMNTLLMLDCLEVTISAYNKFPMSVDILFFWVNVGLWVSIQVGFMLWAYCVIIPRERKKYFELTPEEQLVADVDDASTRGSCLIEHQRLVSNDCSNVAPLASQPERHYIRTFKQMETDLPVEQEIGKKFLADAEAKALRAHTKIAQKSIAKKKSLPNPIFTQSDEPEDLKCQGNPLDNVLKSAQFSQKPKHCNDDGLSWWGQHGKNSKIFDDAAWEEFRRNTWDAIFFRLQKSSEDGIVDIRKHAKELRVAHPKIEQFLALSDTNNDNILTQSEWSNMFQTVRTKYGDPSPSDREALEDFLKNWKG